MIDGGSGTDRASYTAVAGPVTVNLATGSATGDGTDTLKAMEGAIGTAAGDTFTGNAADNTFDGGAGNDTFNTAGGLRHLCGRHRRRHGHRLRGHHGQRGRPVRAGPARLHRDQRQADLLRRRVRVPRQRHPLERHRPPRCGMDVGPQLHRRGEGPHGRRHHPRAGRRPGRHRLRQLRVQGAPAGRRHRHHRHERHRGHRHDDRSGPERAPHLRRDRRAADFGPDDRGDLRGGVLPQLHPAERHAADLLVARHRHRVQGHVPARRERHLDRRGEPQRRRHRHR